MARGLSKRFGPQPALCDVDLELGPGECLAVLGPNGAGKSTLIQLLAGLAQPSSGRLELFGARLERRAARPAGLKRRIGYVGHQTLLYADLTGRENLTFYGRLYDVPDLETRIVEVGLAMGIFGSLDRVVRTYSRGMQQRLTVARAVLHRPELLLLDEPYTGLDEDGRHALTRLLASLKEEGAAILFSTHSPEWGAEVWDRVLLLRGGAVAQRAAGEAVVERTGLGLARHGHPRPAEASSALRVGTP